MKKAKHNMSVSEAAKLNLRAFRIVYATRKKVLALRMVREAYGALTPYVGIWLSARLLDELAGARNPDTLWMLVLWAVGSAALIGVIQSVLDRWHDAEQAGMYVHIDHLMSEKMQSMDYVDIDSPQTHILLSKINQHRTCGGWGLHRATHNFTALWSSLFRIGGGIALTVSLFVSKVPENAGGLTLLNAPWVTVAIIILMLLVTFLAPFFSSLSGNLYAKEADRHIEGNRFFGYYGWLGKRQDRAVDVRIYDLAGFCEKFTLDKTTTFCSKGYFAMLSKGKVGIFQVLSAVASVLFTGIVYLYVCIKGWAGAFGVGYITQYVGAVTMFAGSFRTILAQLGDMRNNAVFLKQVFEFLDIPNNMYQGSLTVEKRRDRDYEIEFRDVSFKYPGSGNYALRHVSIRFKVGQRLAVVGQNGSGKTTFIKLLCRLYDPTEGEILLNGINIRKYDYADYMSVFSVIFQDFNLPALPLGENVAGSTAVDRLRAEQCLRDAGFGERLDSLKDGLDTFLYKFYEPEGMDVSGGEAQKIALARTLYKDAPFIILDEPTAALDPVAEAEIYENFNNIVGDKTAIYISHRLSSCRFCDRIAVFDGGEIVQMGSHDTLVADEDGKYFALWNAQAQYYQKENV